MCSIFRNPAAMAPFFDDVLAVEGRRRARNAAQTIRSTLRACVIDDGVDEPLMDQSTGVTRRRWLIRVRAVDWPEVEPPQVGDVVHIPGEYYLGGDPVRAAVKSVGRHDDDYVMEARQC